jgi:chorismate-pyruvate lyase
VASRFMTRIVAATALTGLTACASTSESGVAQLEALLRQHDSATLALEDWCRSQAIADPTVVAYPIAGAMVREPEDLRERLGVGPDEPVNLRRVRLACGELTLSQASNWFVPARLTADMNAALASTTTPFGKIAAPLQFRRELIDSRRGGGPGCPPETSLFQRALLRLPDGPPLALVEECYVAEGTLYPAR